MSSQQNRGRSRRLRIVDGENGYVVKAAEACQFAQIIHKHFALSRQEREQMEDAGCQKAQTFAYEPHVGNVVSAARYALARSRRGKRGGWLRKMNKLRFVAKSLIYGAVELTADHSVIARSCAAV